MFVGLWERTGPYQGMYPLFPQEDVRDEDLARNSIATRPI